MTASFNALACCLNPNKRDTRNADVVIEDTHGVTATTHTGHDHVRLTPDELWHLPETLFPDDRVKVANHHGIGMRTSNGTDDVVRCIDVRDPVPHSLI